MLFDNLPEDRKYFIQDRSKDQLKCMIFSHNDGSMLPEIYMN